MRRGGGYDCPESMAMRRRNAKAVGKNLGDQEQ